MIFGKTTLYGGEFMYPPPKMAGMSYDEHHLMDSGHANINDAILTTYHGGRHHIAEYQSSNARIYQKIT